MVSLMVRERSIFLMVPILKGDFTRERSSVKMEFRYTPTDLTIGEPLRRTSVKDSENSLMLSMVLATRETGKTIGLLAMEPRNILTEASTMGNFTMD